MFGQLDHPCHHGGLGVLQFPDVLAKEGVAGRLDAVGSLAQVDLVEVHGQDFILGVDLLDLHGEDHLLEFSGDPFFRGKEKVAGQLLGQGASAGAAATAQVDPDDADQAPKVDAIVAVEAAVLHRNDRVLQRAGDAVQGHDRTVFRKEFAQRVAVGGKDDGLDRGGDRLQGLG